MPHGRPAALPARTLPAEVWHRRHRTVVTVAFAHLPLLWAVGMAMGFGALHLVLELLPVAVLAALATAPHQRRRLRTLAATTSLLTSSGALVHLTGGLVESHFHFFVVMSIVLLYQDWVVFAAAFVFVVAHHGVMGVLDPMAVYNHPAAWERPWLWAGLHALFILANCVAGVVNWRAIDSQQARAEADAATLAAQAQELERAGNAKTAFLSRMSHELRTPLNGVLGFGQILEMDDRLHEDARQSVDRILRSGRHLLSLIDEVLEISRIESGRMPLSLGPVAVDGVVADSLELVGPLAQERGISLHRDGVRPGVLVVADEQRLRQVLLNLLSNAVKYNREDGEIVLAVRPGTATVAIEVTDTGAGLSDEDIARLFAPFERLSADDAAIPGTGLGLAISKQLVEAMDGDLSVTSRPGEGSTFTVTLPSSGTAPAAGTPTAAEAAPRPGGLEVVYVEDDPANVELVRRVLERRPEVTLTAASDATVGLALVRERMPGLVLMDLHLPGLDGEQALRRMRADAALRRIPVAVLSADGSQARIDRVLAAGACTYLTKPLDIRRLLELVDDVATSTRARSGTAIGDVPAAARPPSRRGA